MSICRAGVSITAIAGVAAGAAISAFGPAAWSQSSEKPELAGRCADMASVSGYGLKITKAEIVKAQRAPTDDGSADNSKRPMMPEHCLVQGMINERTGVGGRKFGIGFDLRMPLDWNGRFAFHGGGGMDGRLAPALGDIFESVDPHALARGFAVISTDGGHRGDFTKSDFGLDQQARIDYAYNALDKTTLAGKELVARFYGRPARYSYMLGCSNGGRQGMIAAQRLPLLFDGIVSGDASLGFSRIAIGEVWNAHQVEQIAPKDAQGRAIHARAFSDADLKLVRAGVLKQCDVKDGLADGIIHDWQGCDFDPAVLTCKGGKTASCLTGDQVRTLKALHEGPRRKDGSVIYGSFNYDTGIAQPTWRGMRLGSATSGAPNSADATLGDGQFKLYQSTPADPNFDFRKPIDLAEAEKRVRYTGAMSDADSPLINTFASHGKMIVYNGLSDQGMASAEFVKWYDKAVAASGDAVKNSVRMFFVPGMTHCKGGEATDKFDMLSAIMAWVEEGKAPDRIVATSRSVAMAGVSRPLCPYPTVARYKGGDPKSAASFECRK